MTEPSTNTPKPGISPWGWPLVVIIVTFVLDQLSKIVIDKYCELGWNQPVIPGFFNLVYLQNKGAAWGIFNQHTWLLAMISTAAFVFILFIFKKQNEGNKLAAFALALLEGGIAGNMVDRIFRAAVIDFLDFHIAGYHWPAFNIADSAICVSIALLLYIQLFPGRKALDAKDGEAAASKPKK